MHKSKLQELCQKKAWTLPEYNITKQGQDHNPRFEATVNVNGMTFHSQNPARSSKEAQNDAAYLAFVHFTSPPLPGPGFSTAIANSDSNIANTKILQPERQEANRDSQVTEPASNCKDVQHLYKNVLQNFAQKRNLSRPAYSYESKGPPHASRFSCKVTINDKTYESLEFFPTIKEAEHAAAKIALSCLSPNAIEEEDSSLYKNLLQELTQKEGYLLPVYDTARSGEAHASTFVSSVKVKGEVFTGQVAKTKKQAECLAAKVAYMKLKECMLNRGSMIIAPAYQEREVHVLSSSHLPSNVNSDTQQNLGSKARALLNRNSTSGVGQQENRVTFSNHQPSFPFPQPEMTTDWQSSSSSLNVYDHPQPEDDLYAYEYPSNQLATASSVEDSIKQPVRMSNLSSATTNSVVKSIKQPVVTSNLFSASTNSVMKSITQPVGTKSITQPVGTSNISSASTNSVVKSITQPVGTSNLSSAATNSVVKSITQPDEISNLSCNRTIVLPRVPNMKLPAGSTLKPMSDDHWVAVELRSQPSL